MTHAWTVFSFRRRLWGAETSRSHYRSQYWRLSIRSEHGTEHRIPLVKVGEISPFIPALPEMPRTDRFQGTVRNVRVEEERTILGVQFMNLTIRPPYNSKNVSMKC